MNLAAPTGAVMLAWGVLQPGEERTLVYEKQLPDGVSVTLFSPDRRGRDIAITSQPENRDRVTYRNHGTVPASFMLFAVTPRAVKILDGLRMLASAFKRPDPKEPPHE